jgi:hypothetical protein
LAQPKQSRPRSPRNKFELKLQKELKKFKGWKATYESDKIPYVLTRDYIPDFTVQGPSGRIIFLEGKGHFDDTARSKMAAVKRHNPTLDIRIIFYRANQFVRKKSSMTYAKWADKYGFPWAEGSIPKEWFK